MILNKLAVFKDTAAKAPTLPVFTVMSLQTAFSVAVVVRERRAVTQRIALQWLPVCRPVLLSDSVCCSAPSAGCASFYHHARF